MIYQTLKTLSVALFCSVVLAACSGGCGSGDDMAEMEGAMPEAAEEMAEAGDEMADEAEGAADAAAGAAAGATASAGEMADSAAAGAGSLVGDVAAVTGMGAEMEVADIELNVGEVALPDYGWKLKWFGANDINQPVNGDITLRFAAGSLAGSAGCNDYTGDYDTGADRAVSMGEIATTRKMCPDDVMNTEDRFLGMLRTIHRYEFKKDGLYLYNPPGDWLHFVPMQPAE
jgi:heat shock protein HslJ